MFDPNWIIAGVAVLGVLGGLWKLASAIGQNTAMTKEILSNQKSQWKKIDEHAESIDNHGDRIIKLEAWKEFRDKEAK